MGFIGIDIEGNARVYSEEYDVKPEPELNIVARLDVNEDNLRFIVKKMCEELEMVCENCGAVNSTVGENENIDKKLCSFCFAKHYE